jgi:hypothetical protein
VPLDWERMRRDEFERVVESLIYRVHKSVGKVTVPDGRGGDAGIDLLVEVDDQRIVYQLKHFVSGFSGDQKGRRQQIKRSLERAIAAAQPSKWILVVPAKLTSSERHYVEKLGQAKGVPVDVLDRVALDDMAVSHRDLVDYFVREHLLEAAKTYGQEKAVITGGSAEVSERLAGLGRAVDAIDPDWTFDLLWQSGKPVHVLRAKHPYAARVSPITIDVEANLGSASAELGLAVKRIFGFGGPGSVTLPPDMIIGFHVNGPSWITASHEAVSVRWVSQSFAEAVGKRMELRSLDKTGVTLASFEGEVTHAGGGPEGHSLVGQFYGAASLSFYLPKGGGPGGSLDYSTDVNGLEPTQMLLALDLDETVFSCQVLEILVDGRSVGKVEFSADRGLDNAARADEFDGLRLLAEDLVVVQGHCRQHFAVPRELTKLDRILIRCVRLMVEGKCALWPGVNSIRIELSGEDREGLRELLLQGGFGLRFQQDAFPLEIAGRTLNLGSVALYHLNVWAVDGAAAVAALESGTAVGREVELRAGDGELFRFYMPDKWMDENVPLTPMRWNIPGIADPKELALEVGSAAESRS